MGFNKKAWTPEEDALLFARIASGEPQVDIARSFAGRSEKSVLTRIGRVRGTDNQNLDRRKAKNSSEKLVKATMRLMAAMPEPILRDLLWPVMRETIPGTERVYKTASAERLAA